MDRIRITDLRCFHSTQEVPLAPLTFLVGENSTGKSTFLAAVRIAHDVARGIRQPDFNEEPFQLGAYDQIANIRTGRGEGRADSFRLGFGISSLKKQGGKLPTQEDIEFEAEFCEMESQPTVKKWSVKSGSYRITAEYLDAVKKSVGDSIEVNLDCPSGTAKEKYPDIFFEHGPDFLEEIIDVYLHFRRHSVNPPFSEIFSRTKLKNEDLKKFAAMLRSLMPKNVSRPYAMAPIRTEPRRTYHPSKEVKRAAGAHVPMELAGYSFGDKTEWEELREQLSDFGTRCGLFKDLNVKRLGRNLSDPFQLEVKVAGRPSNLVDVGYGVSQALPILVDSFVTDRVQYLIQQPEVHLHPKAQAELGSLFGELVNRKKKRFLIETHSDYIIDRVRLDVRDGKSISADQVMILYFERTGQNIKIHPIRIDEEGNILDAPDGYRDFFIKEENRFYGV